MTGATARPGLLVTLDGPGGAGKTTTAGCLVELLAARGHAVYATRQPSGERLGETSRHGGYQGRALACLVAADRYHHLDTEIYPALAARKIVVCDRYVASSYVLQRMDGVDIEFIEASTATPPRPAWPSSWPQTLPPQRPASKPAAPATASRPAWPPAQRKPRSTRTPPAASLPEDGR